MEEAFEIEIREVLSRVETIQAASVGEAIDKAMELYHGQKIVLDSGDFKGNVEFTPAGQEKQKIR